MLGVVGTVPEADFPLVHGAVPLDGDHLVIDGHRVPVNRGTPALLGAICRAAEVLAVPEIYAFLVGDIGRGQGSRRLYEYLCDHLPRFACQVLAFHYLQPDVDWHNRVLFAIEEMDNRPLLIADAGFMYAAKMSGQAGAYDLFTPDAGELSFLADETAPHPFYTRGFILQDNLSVPALIRRATAHENAARCMLVKGKTDYVVQGDDIVATVDQPACPAMEAIGGTGDTLTGLVTVLCGYGCEPERAADLAARINRWCGHLADLTPATQVMDLIARIPAAITRVLPDA